MAALATMLLVGCGSEPPTDPTGGGNGGNSNGSAAATVTLSSGDLTFGAIGSSVTLAATVKDSSGNTLTASTVRWSTVGTTVVSVSGTGIVTARANGSDVVRATSGSASAEIRVVVSQVAMGIEITSGPPTITVLGRTSMLTASVVDSLGNPIAGSAPGWTSLDTTIALVAATGQVTAAAEGVVAIVASSGARADSVTVSVRTTGPVGSSIAGSVESCAGATAGPFPCAGIDLLSYTTIGGLGGGSGIEINDVWGWTDPLTGNEYAIIGRTNGFAFVDVTDPLNPVYEGELRNTSGSPANAWHDVKIYNDHAFFVADGAPGHGMQVFDLTRLRNTGSAPVTFSESTIYFGVSSVHNIAINEQTGFAYLTGSNGGAQTCGGGLHMVNIQNPINPTFAGCFADPLTGRGGTGYTHDVQCVVYSGPDTDHQGREICFGLNETALSVADVTDKANPVAVSRTGYPGVNYAHQGWLTEDQRYFYSNDELDELNGATSFSRTLIWDVTDLDDPILVNEHLGPTGAIDHNNYVVGDRLYISNYQAGLRVLDITDPENPTEAASFDTAPNMPNTLGFGGSWSNYPFFASGTIVVTSGGEGLLLLKLAP